MSETAVLVVDMLNSYGHEDAARLATNVEPIVEPLSDLIRRARDHDDIDLVYVNDNYGDFTADYDDIVNSALDGRRPDLVQPIKPVPGSSVMLTKVRHSAFYATPLAYLLRDRGTRRVVLTGQVTEQCILYTALDGYIRHFDVIVAEDAVAHIDEELGRAAIKMMHTNMRAEIRSASDCLG